MGYLRIIVKGTIGTEEKWSNSLNYRITGGASDLPDNDLVTRVLARLLSDIVAGSFPNDLKNLISTAGSIVGFRVEKRGEDEVLLSMAEGNLAAPIVGLTSPTKTPQDALVVSLLTSSVGGAGRGRFYLPALGAVMSGSFQLTSPSPTLAVAAAKSWLNEIKIAADLAMSSVSDPRRFVLVVRSPTNHSDSIVNALRVGSLLDTQRRRRDALKETYVSTTFPS